MQTLASVIVAIAAAGGEPLSVTPIYLQGDPLPGGATVVEITGIDVNSAGSWVVTLDTDDADPHADKLIVHDGAVVITEGDFIGPDGGYVTILGAGTLNDRGGAFLVEREAGCPEDSVPPPAGSCDPCLTDIVRDGETDIDDLLVLLAYFGTPRSCDATGDGFVDIDDILAVIGAWGPCP